MIPKNQINTETIQQIRNETITHSELLLSTFLQQQNLAHTFLKCSTQRAITCSISQCDESFGK